MFPWIEMSVLIFKLLPQFIISPIFWLVLLLVYSQYRRLNRLEQKMYGFALSSVGKQVWRSVLFGLLGGVVGSFVLTLVGVSLTGAGIMYVWPVAILLMLVNPRFMCFAYAGGIVSLSHLILGFPDLEIPQLLALVAVLHMVESLLILLTGHVDPTPIIIKKTSDQLVGGFNLQKFWPIPVVVMLAVAVDMPDQLPDLIRMPEWWPLLRPRELPGAGEELVYSLFLVTAALGYSDLALTCTPRVKARRSAAHLALYSVALLLAAVSASFYKQLLLVAALLAPLGHELVVHLGNRREFGGRALFTPPPRGVMVLATVPGGLAARYKLVPGEVILELAGREVASTADLTLGLEQQVPPWEMVTLQPGEEGFRKRSLIIGETVSNLGVIPVPTGNNGPYVQIKRHGFLQQWLRRLQAGGKGDGEG